MSNLKLAGFLARSSVNGPGIRAVIWVQGCPFNCDGCFNPDFLPFSPTPPVDVKDLAARILALDGIDGVTFSGGEPFTQAGPLAELGAILHSADLSVVTFTGFTWDQINAKNRPAWRRLLSVTDLLIAGPYVNEKHTGLHGRAGVPGKCIIRLRNGQPDNGHAGNFTYPYSGDEIEFIIRPDGQMEVTGFPGSRLSEKLTSLSSGGL